jgi:hypothetical protein
MDGLIGKKARLTNWVVFIIAVFVILFVVHQIPPLRDFLTKPLSKKTNI